MSMIEAVTAIIPIVVNCSSARRRGGRVAEGGGLLILPALFVLTDFHMFCLR